VVEGRAAVSNAQTAVARRLRACPSWLTLLLVIGGSLLAWGLPTIVVPLATDQVTYALGARTILDGDQLYRDLWLTTEDYAKFRSRPVDLLLVWTLPDTATEALARRQGVGVEIYRPAWVDEWLLSLTPRGRRAARVT